MTPTIRLGHLCLPRVRQPDRPLAAGLHGESHKLHLRPHRTIPARDCVAAGAAKDRV